VLAARTHSNLGEIEEGGRVAEKALTEASEAGDPWAMGWALHVLALVAMVQGNLTDAVPVYDRALAVTQANPELADLRLLLQINKAVALANLDRYTEALPTAQHAVRLATQVGTTMRLTQAYCVLAQILFDAGRWDDALTCTANLPEDLKEPSVACCDLAIGALINFHRGQNEAASQCLNATSPLAKRIGHRLVPQLALAGSLDQEQARNLPAALTALTEWFDGGSEELGQAEDLVADAVRLAVKADDFTTAQRLAKHAEEFAEGSEIPRQQANALYCSGLVEHDADKLIASADRYRQASRPLQMAKALEAAAEEFLTVDDRNAARDAFGRAVDAYTSLGAAADVNRVQAAFREQGMRLGSHAKHRKAQSGWDALTDTELKIAAFVAEGLSNPEIAQRLVTSPRTVGTHVSHILKKLQFASRAEIAREYALRSGPR
jgi:DNA-binding CsgD family transcriptional regulator